MPGGLPLASDVPGMAPAVPGTYGSVLPSGPPASNRPGDPNSVRRLRFRASDRDAVAFHARVKRPAGDPQERRRLSLVALSALQRLLDEALLDLIQTQAEREELGWIRRETRLPDREMNALYSSRARE